MGRHDLQGELGSGESAVGDAAGASLIPRAVASSGVPCPRYLALMASLFFLRSSISLDSSTGSSISTTRGSTGFVLSFATGGALGDVSSSVDVDTRGMPSDLSLPVLPTSLSRRRFESLLRASASRLARSIGAGFSPRSAPDRSLDLWCSFPYRPYLPSRLPS